MKQHMKVHKLDNVTIIITISENNNKTFCLNLNILDIIKNKIKPNIERKKDVLSPDIKATWIEVKIKNKIVIFLYLKLVKSANVTRIKQDLTTNPPKINSSLKKPEILLFSNTSVL